tara:strand:- start:3127 stop:3765 length:639 start_codon:yes stop_codon:yes gene_type:complete
MGHELSITLQDPRDKKYINLPSSWLLADESDVRLANNPSETEIQGAVLNAYLEKALKPLGNKKFGTVDEAVNAAIKRSEETDIKHEHKKLIPKNKEKYISEYLMSLRNIPEDVEEGMMGFRDNSERNSKMPDMDKNRFMELMLMKKDIEKELVEGGYDEYGNPNMNVDYGLNDPRLREVPLMDMDAVYTPSPEEMEEEERRKRAYFDVLRDV